LSKPPVPTAKGLERLVQALRVLPGVGPRSAQRMAFHLLQHERAGADELAQALTDALASVQRCVQCNNFSEQEVCAPTWRWSSRRCRTRGCISC
jgi:recombination protein RecR